MAGSAPGVQAEARDGLRWWHGPALRCSIRGTQGKAVTGRGRWEGASTQGLELQLPGRLQLIKELKIRISPGIPEVFIWRAESARCTARLTFNSSNPALVPGIHCHPEENEGEAVPVSYGCAAAKSSKPWPFQSSWADIIPQ